MVDKGGARQPEIEVARPFGFFAGKNAKKTHSRNRKDR
jgi:hypothetical protein